MYADIEKMKNLWMKRKVLISFTCGCANDDDPGGNPKLGQNTAYCPETMACQHKSF